MKNSVKRLIAFILLICTLALSMASCDFAGIFNKSTPLEYGFGGKNNLETPIESAYACAYRSDKNIFDIDDVTLEFYFGRLHIPGIEFNAENISESYPSFGIYFYTNSKEKIIVKKYEENFVSEKYRWELEFDENGNTTGKRKFYYSETFTVPKELFDNKTGRIYFGIYGTNVKALEPKFERITSLGIYYKVSNGKVVLSNDKFE